MRGSLTEGQLGSGSAPSKFLLAMVRQYISLLHAREQCADNNAIFKSLLTVPTYVMTFSFCYFRAHCHFQHKTAVFLLYASHSPFVVKEIEKVCSLRGNK
jgi:hypothetical protein